MKLQIEVSGNRQNKCIFVYWASNSNIIYFAYQCQQWKFSTSTAKYAIPLIRRIDIRFLVLAFPRILSSKGSKKTGRSHQAEKPLSPSYEWTLPVSPASTSTSNHSRNTQGPRGARRFNLGNRGLKMILTTSVSLEKGDGIQNSDNDTALTKNSNNHKASTRNEGMRKGQACGSTDS